MDSELLLLLRKSIQALYMMIHVCCLSLSNADTCVRPKITELIG